MLETLQHWLLLCSPWSSVPPVLIGIAFFRQYNRGGRILCIHLFIACIIDLSAQLLRFLNSNNLPLLHVYTLTEFILLYLFLEYHWNNFYPKRLLRSIATGFVTFSVINSLFIQNIYTFNSYARGLEALLLIIFSLLSFYRIFQDASVTAARQPVWIIAGILIYFSGAFTLFVLSNYILPLGVSLNFQILAVHACLSIMLYVFISIGLWKMRKR